MERDAIRAEHTSAQAALQQAHADMARQREAHAAEVKAQQEAGHQQQQQPLERMSAPRDASEDLQVRLQESNYYCMLVYMRSQDALT